MKNKKGWIRIVEVFVAILLITGAILIIVNQGYVKNSSDADKIYDAEVAVLREIELDESLREAILIFPESNLPIKWSNPNFPEKIREKIQNEIPEYLECSANICVLNDLCGIENYVEKDIYVQSVAIVANFQIYNPRQVKIFCWRK